MMRVQLPITLDCLWAGFKYSDSPGDLLAINLKDLRKYKEPQMTETKKHKKAIQRLR